ncbi:unnamed protein product [Rhizoctonia solani]|uniref:Uncharacterized protein n=1 Tax=Rhizoctonia solani TaxID=456999 RepID=A0A8H3HX00_9AGAM|nr:unnamed protein product [Rhizoctonia solani]
MLESDLEWFSSSSEDFSNLQNLRKRVVNAFEPHKALPRYQIQLRILLVLIGVMYWQLDGIQLLDLWA